MMNVIRSAPTRVSMQDVEAPTMAFPPEVIKMSDQVPAMVARGQTVPWHLARAHSDANPKPRAHDIKGCYKLESECNPFCKLCPFYVCNDTCACCGTPAEDGFISTGCILGIPLAICCVFWGSCERDGNGWVTRDKHGVKTGEILVLDEQGTHAYYSLKCCSNHFNETPCCVAKKASCCGEISVPIKG